MKNNKYIKGLIRYFRRTAGNKIAAMALILLGTLATLVSGDATALVFISIIAIPLFFANKNHIV